MQKDLFLVSETGGGEETHPCIVVHSTIDKYFFRNRTCSADNSTLASNHHHHDHHISGSSAMLGGGRPEEVDITHKKMFTCLSFCLV